MSEQNQKPNDWAEQLDQNVRKLRFAWEKLNEFLDKNSDVIESMAKTEVNNLKEGFQKTVDNVRQQAKEYATNVEEQVSSLSGDGGSSEGNAQDLSSFLQELKSRAENFTKEFSEELQSKENKTAWNSAKEKANFNLKQANMHFNSSLESLQKAVEAYANAISTISENIQKES